MTLRAQLDGIKVAIDQAERAPILFATQPAKLFGLVRQVGGLLEAIVSQLERSSTDGNHEGIDRHL